MDSNTYHYRFTLIHTNPINSVNFNHDSTKLATGSSDFTTKIWDINNQNPIITLKGHTESINSVCFSPDGTYLATGSTD